MNIYKPKQGDYYGLDSAWEPEGWGFIKLHREFLFHAHPLHPLTRGERACHAFAWHDLVGHAERKNRLGGLVRGQLSHAQSYFATRWRWGEGMVADFFRELESPEVVLIKRKHQPGRKPDIITVVNYDYYSTPDHQVRGVKPWTSN